MRYLDFTEHCLCQYVNLHVVSEQSHEGAYKTKQETFTL